MIYRDFKGQKISGLGMGMMRLPVIDGDDSKVDEKQAEKMIAYAMEHGVNYYDTAWGYHGETSENVAGKFLNKYPRSSYCLASKFPGYDNSNMPKVKEIFEKQLEKCNTEYFDFYLLHNVYEGNIDDYLDPKFGILDYLLEQKQAGRIRHLGFSCHGTVDIIRRFMESPYGRHMEFCQLQLNYMDWHFQKCDEKAAYCREMGLPVFVMEPVRGGKICEAPDGMREQLKKMRPDESDIGWAFRFIQTIPDVVVTLTGASSLVQLQQNISIWEEDKPLNEEEFSRLLELVDGETKKIGVPCTGCNYCASHCPQKLPIATLISAFNEHMSTKGKPSFFAPMLIGAMDENKRPDQCIACRSCEKVCPQQLPIADTLKEFADMLHG